MRIANELKEISGEYMPPEYETTKQHLMPVTVEWTLLLLIIF